MNFHAIFLFHMIQACTFCYAQHLHIWQLRSLKNLFNGLRLLTFPALAGIYESNLILARTSLIYLTFNQPLEEIPVPAYSCRKAFDLRKLEDYAFGNNIFN
jgi:hypothetical protein